MSDNNIRQINNGCYGCFLREAGVSCENKAAYVRNTGCEVRWIAYAKVNNPVEQVWNRSKYAGLANYIGELEKEVCESISHLRWEQSLLRSFF